MMTKNTKGMLMCACLVIFGLATDSSARRSHINEEQRAKLEKIQTVYLNVLALTEDGKIPSDDLVALIQPRLEKLGYTVVTDRKAPADVQLWVKCEEQKRWKGTTRSGGDAELADSPSRLWRGPACLFNYRLDGQDLGWYKETRTNFEDAYAAAKKAKVKNSGLYAMSQLKLKLQEFDFPVMIATEWGHTDRLAKLLEAPETSKARKLRILSTLSKVASKEAFPYLIKLAHDENTEFATKAIIALAGIGSSAIPNLTDIFVTSKNSQIQAAAAKGLGLIGARTGDPAITPPLLDYLNRNLEDMDEPSDIDFPVLTEVVWSISKLRSDQSIAPIEKLNIKIWLIRDNSKEMKKLRDAANVATKMVDLDYQIM